MDEMKAGTLSRRAFVGALTTMPLAASSGWCAKDDVRIAFVGDSLSDGMWGGATRLVSQEACLGQRVKLGRFAENGTGLTRPAKYDWVAEGKTVVAKFKPNLSIVSLGLNDRQSIVDNSRARFDLGTPGWRTRYLELSQALVRNLEAADAGVLWIGLPILRDKPAQDDAAEKNAIFADAIRQMGDPKVRFVEPWRQNPTGPDAFQPYGHDLRGAEVQIRATDGIHFTAAGYDVLAAHLFRQVAGFMTERGLEMSYPCQQQAQR
ncbi:SGNH/GDSL hydrolase family protein [Methylobacterium persicinum]|uniref:SGNH/GDSL hydrolase family protein n=2 Tax=Methylobacterium persicinum TaxID=374426 RepID=UPI002080F349|nr:GDSL-type esterase/lipase family protein [Methylobacterium persicinum]GJE39786.1 hypothetical protein KHHGKMAE_3872 [Methylobacterium persicinum]